MDDDGLVLDGRRFDGDVRGVVDTVSATAIEVDGETYDLGDEVIVFAAASLQSVTLASRVGNYVVLGLDGGDVEWVATVGDVLPGAGLVLFQDEVALVDGDVVFASGFSSAVADGVTVPDTGPVLVEIDPVTDLVVRASPA